MPQDGYYVEPESTIYLLSDIALDPSYLHTIWWTSKEAQQTWFISQARFKYEAQYYQRYNKGSLRVNELSDDIVTCNYMVFVNGAYSEKYYYAFITDVEYSANNVATIYYQIDELQTWFFEMKRLPCFIERQHSAHDYMFENLVQEDFDLGPDYVCNQSWKYDMSDQDVCLIVPGNLQQNGSNKVSFTDNGLTVMTDTIQNTLPIPINVLIGEAELGDTTDNVLGKGLQGIYTLLGIISKNTELNDDTILNLSCCPRMLNNADDYVCDDTNWANALSRTEAKSEHPDVYTIPHPLQDFEHCYIKDTASENIYARQLQWFTEPTTIDGYTPINNKLYTSPYSFLLGLNNCGDTQSYYWEMFTDENEEDDHNRAYFMVNGTKVPEPVVEITPVNYRGMSADFTNSMQYSNFCEIPWCTSTWLTYWAQHKNQTVLGIAKDIGTAATNINPFHGTESLIGAVLGSAIGGMPGMFAGAAMGSTLTTAVNDTLDVVAKKKDLAQNPPNVLSYSDSGYLNGEIGKCQFSFYGMSVKADVAERIDTYFSMYGYAQRIVAVPEMHLRKHWTFTKTIGCNIDGELPASAKRTIEAIFDNGITFWANPTEVGMYTEYWHDNGYYAD